MKCDRTFAARVLGPDDARASFVLARMAEPNLDLRDWARTIRAVSRRGPGTAIIGICNSAGCFLALLRLSGGQLSLMIASAVVAGAERELFCVARRVAQHAG